MLVEFSVENYRSYLEQKSISLVASSGDEKPENAFSASGVKGTLLKSAAIYGANASGKSNLLAAMDCLGEMIGSSFSRPLLGRLPISPFALSPSDEAQLTRFAVRFVQMGVLFEYKIGVGGEVVREESLTAHPHGRPQVWFERHSDNEFKFNATHLRGQKQKLEQVTPTNAPFLSVAALFNHPQLAPPARWIADSLRQRPGIGHPVPGHSGLRSRDNLANTLRRCQEDAQFQTWVNQFLRHADLGIAGVEIESVKQTVNRPVARPIQSGQGFATAQEQVTEEVLTPRFIHPGVGGRTAKFNLQDESHGTQRFFSMLGPLYEIIREGQLLVIDEFGSSFHTSMVREIIRSFHDAAFNPNGAQLIFTTHDTSLLSGNLFRRDQVWFTEKNRAGATDLYSLHDIKGVREDDSFEKGYLRGRYGAIPFFSKFDFPIIKQEEEEG